MGSDKTQSVGSTTNNKQRALRSRKVTKQPLHRPRSRKDHLSSVPGGASEENGRNDKKTKNKSKWIQIFNPFRRKKRSKTKKASFSNIADSKTNRKHCDKSRKRKKNTPSLSESSLLSSKNVKGRVSSDDLSISSESSETDSVLSNDTDAPEKDIKFARENFSHTKSNNSENEKRCNEELIKCSLVHNLKKQSCCEQQLLSQDAPKSSSRSSIKTKSRRKKSLEVVPLEGTQPQINDELTKSPDHKITQNSKSTVSVKTHSRHASPVDFASENPSISNAENNCKFLTPPSSPGYLTPIQYSIAKEQLCGSRAKSKTNKPAQPRTENQHATSEPNSPRPARHRRKRKHKYQRSPRNSLNSPPPLCLQPNQLEESVNSGRNHYLVVEVVYHGRSLEAEEKAQIQAQVAQTVDELLKRGPTSPRSDTMPPEKKTQDYVGDGQTLPACKDYCNTQFQNIDKYIEFQKNAEIQQPQERLLSTPGEAKLMDSTTPAAPKTMIDSTRKSSQQNRYTMNNLYSTPLEQSPFQFHSRSTKPIYSKSNYNRFNNTTYNQAKTQMSTSEPIDYIKYPDLRPAYVQTKRSIHKGFQPVGRTPISAGKNKLQKEMYDARNDNSFMNLMNYMNKETTNNASQPIPSQRHNLSSQSPSLPKIRSLMPFDERSSLEPFSESKAFASPAMMSLKNYASSVMTESPFSTPSCTPIPKLHRSMEPTTMPFYQPSEANPIAEYKEEQYSFFNPSAEAKVSHTLITDKREAHFAPFPTHTPVCLTPSKALLSSNKWRQKATPTEHDAWWMPREWARERRIGAYGKGWRFTEDEDFERKTALEQSKQPNVEKIRTCNFIRL